MSDENYEAALDVLQEHVSNERQQRILEENERKERKTTTGSIAKVRSETYEDDLNHAKVVGKDHDKVDEAPIDWNSSAVTFAEGKPDDEGTSDNITASDDNINIASELHNMQPEKTAKHRAIRAVIDVSDDETESAHDWKAALSDFEKSDDETLENVRVGESYERFTQLIDEFQCLAIPFRAGIDKVKSGKRHSASHDVVAQSPTIDFLLSGLRYRWHNKFASNSVTQMFIDTTIDHIATEILPSVQAVFAEMWSLFTIKPISETADTDTVKPYLPPLTEMKDEKEVTQQGFLNLLKDCACIIAVNIATKTMDQRQPSWTPKSVSDVLGRWSVIFVRNRARAFCPRSIKLQLEEKERMKDDSAEFQPFDVGINSEVWRDLLIPTFVSVLWSRKPHAIWLPAHRLAQLANDASGHDLEIDTKTWTEIAVSTLINVERTLSGFGIRDQTVPRVLLTPKVSVALGKTRAQMRESFHGQALALGDYYIQALQHVLRGIHSLGQRNKYPPNWLEYLYKFNESVEKLAPQLREWIRGVFLCRKWQWSATGTTNKMQIKWIVSAISLFTVAVVRSRHRSTSVQPFSVFPEEDAQFWTKELKCCSVYPSKCEHDHLKTEFLANVRRLSHWYTYGNSISWLLFGEGESTTLSFSKHLKESLDFCLVASRIVCNDLSKVNAIQPHLTAVELYYGKSKHLIDEFVRKTMVESYTNPDQKKVDSDTDMLRKADNVCTEFYKVLVELINDNVLKTLQEKIPSLKLQTLFDGSKQGLVVFGTRTLFGLSLLRPLIAAHLAQLESAMVPKTGLKYKLLVELRRRIA